MPVFAGWGRSGSGALLSTAACCSSSLLTREQTEQDSLPARTVKRLKERSALRSLLFPSLHPLSLDPAATSRCVLAYLLLCSGAVCPTSVGEPHECVSGRVHPAGAEICVLIGESATGLLHAAERSRAPLIVLGTHGRRTSPRGSIGTTAERVCAESTVPVLLVSNQRPSGRINVVIIPVPPLRPRGNDILLLAQHFLKQQPTRSGKAVTGLSDAAARRLLDYDWPGNVRGSPALKRRARCDYES